MNQYFVWIDDKNKVIGKPDLYTSLDDVKWDKKPTKAKCFVKGDMYFLYEYFGCKHHDFNKWEYKDGTT